MQERLKEKLQRAKEVAEEMTEKQQTPVISGTEAQASIVVYEDWTGQEIKLSPKIVRDFINPKANLVDIAKFIAVCKTYRLNPFLSDAYLVKYDEREPAQIIVSRFAFMRVATRHESYRGFKSGVIVIRRNPDKKRHEFLQKTEKLLREIADKVSEHKAEILEALLELHKIEDELSQHEVDIMEVEGAFVPPGWTLYGGWCVVYLEQEGKITEVWQKVLLSEYNREKASWKVMPATMIQKVAEAHAFRKAFPDLLSGLYIPEEMGGDINGQARTYTASVSADTGSVEMGELETEPTNL